MRIYLDSNVFISLFEREVGKGVRGLFVEAELFLDKVKNEGHLLVLSKWFFSEVRSKFFLSKKEILDYFKKNNVEIETFFETGDLGVISFMELGIHRSDALHIAIAVHLKCDCIVTFNVKDFQKQNKIKVLEPKEF